MNIILGFLRGLKWPARMLAGLFRKRKKNVISKIEQNQRKYVRNFDPTRLKNVSYQKRTGEKLSEGQKKWKKRRGEKKIF